MTNQIKWLVTRITTHNYIYFFNLRTNSVKGIIENVQKLAVPPFSETTEFKILKHTVNVGPHCSLQDNLSKNPKSKF